MSRLAAIITILHILIFFIWVIYWRCSLRDHKREVRRLLDNEDYLKCMTKEVIGNITHDLKTPLTAIQGYAQGILDGVVTSPEILNRYASTIKGKSEDMTSLVEDLSTFAEIYDSTPQYSMREVRIREYISNCIASLSLDMELKEISLVFQFHAASDAKVYIDKEKIKRVIHNIIGNSIKYIRAEIGVIMTSVEETEESIVIHISDNGDGIAKEDLNNIFEKFYRTDQSRSTNPGGSGLGLSIAKKITEDHNGKIWAQSVLGQGTTISISLPKLVDGIVNMC